MSERHERDALRFAARRAAFLDALRRGDPVAAARAASRVRVAGLPLSPAEFARARDTRRRLGRAIVAARARRPEEVAARREPRIYAGPPSRRRRAALAIAAALALVVLFFMGSGPGLGPGEAGGAPPAAAASEQRVTLLTVSRGRTVALPPEVVAVVEPSPSPSVAPSPSATPQSTAPPAARPTTGSASGSTGATGSGGSGGGSGSGSGGGGGGILRTPTPRPTATPPVPPPGFSRLNIIVLDSRTRRPIADVCIVIGTQHCGPNAPHTDANGRWSADVAASSARTLWDIYFIKEPYVTAFRQITLPGGVSRTYIIELRRPRGAGG